MAVQGNHKTTASTGFMPFVDVAIVFIFVASPMIAFYMGGMSPFGSAINGLGVILGVAALARNSPALFVLFLALDLLLGPFILPVQGLFPAETAFFGRIDYFFAYLFFLFKVKSFWFDTYLRRDYLVLLLSVVLVASIGILQATEEVPLKESVAGYYAVFANLLLGYLGYDALRNMDRCSHRIREIVFLILLSVLVIHILISVTQLLFDVRLRQSTLLSYFLVDGYKIVRPAGLLGAFYVYGVTTMLYIYLMRSVYKFNYALLTNTLFGIALVISFISSRASILAAVIYIFVLLYRKSDSKRLFASAATLLGTAFLVLLFTNYWTLVAMEQSNGTKLALWYLAITDILFNFDLLQWLTGAGLDRSALLANDIVQLLNAYAPGASYDNRIDLGEGFPIHNVYIQIAYEFGIPIAIMVFVLLVRSISNMLQGKIVGLESFAVLAAIINYSLHNGLFAWTLVMVLLMATRIDR